MLLVICTLDEDSPPQSIQLYLLNVGHPRTVDAALDGLICRALLGVTLQKAIDFLSHSRRKAKVIAKANLGDLHHAADLFDVALHLGDEILR
jgi:hypothetical protein